MTTIKPSLKFFLNVTRMQAIVTRRFDARLGSLSGLGLNEFMILYHLSQSRDGQMRRIDLADKIGLTASGITRLLAPMEKIGLIKREANPADARVSSVALAASGKRKLAEALPEAELLADELISSGKTKKLEELTDLVADIGGNAKWN